MSKRQKRQPKGSHFSSKCLKLRNILNSQKFSEFSGFETSNEEIDQSWHHWLASVLIWKHFDEKWHFGEKVSGVGSDLIVTWLGSGFDVFNKHGFDSFDSFDSFDRLRGALLHSFDCLSKILRYWLFCLKSLDIDCFVRSIRIRCLRACI